MLDGKMFLPVVGQRLVEGRVILFGDLLRLTSPDGLLLVQLLPFVSNLLNLFLLLLLLLFILDLLDLSFLGLLHLLLVIGDLFLGCLLNLQHDRVIDELGMLLHQILDPALFEVLLLIFLEVKEDAGSASMERLGVLRHSECTAGGGLPLVAVIVVVLGDDHDAVGDEVCGIETDSELTNHADVGTGLNSLHEAFRSRLSNGAQVVDEVSLRHADPRVNDGQSLVGFVGDQPDPKFRFSVQDALVRQRLVPNFVQGI
mmetsp:Transcript_20449/g.35154  ORF Transcript_20449/g.35154 Transcript_20449/m.35154 type:complete len:257 (-) Transcript_20449:210-980(-)